MARKKRGSTTRIVRKHPRGAGVRIVRVRDDKLFASFVDTPLYHKLNLSSVLEGSGLHLSPAVVSDVSQLEIQRRAPPREESPEPTQPAPTLNLSTDDEDFSLIYAINGVVQNSKSLKHPVKRPSARHHDTASALPCCSTKGPEVLPRQCNNTVPSVCAKSDASGTSSSTLQIVDAQSPFGSHAAKKTSSTLSAMDVSPTQQAAYTLSEITLDTAKTFSERSNIKNTRSHHLADTPIRGVSDASAADSPLRSTTLCSPSRCENSAILRGNILSPTLKSLGSARSYAYEGFKPGVTSTPIRASSSALPHDDSVPQLSGAASEKEGTTSGSALNANSRSSGQAKPTSTDLSTALLLPTSQRSLGSARSYAYAGFKPGVTSTPIRASSSALPQDDFVPQLSGAASQKEGPISGSTLNGNSRASRQAKPTWADLSTALLLPTAKRSLGAAHSRAYEGFNPSGTSTPIRAKSCPLQQDTSLHQLCEAIRQQEGASFGGLSGSTLHASGRSSFHEGGPADVSAIPHENVMSPCPKRSQLFGASFDDGFDLEAPTTPTRPKSRALPHQTPLQHLCQATGQDGVQEFDAIPIDWDTVVKLGEGTYGEVFAAEWNGEAVAFKVIPFLSEPLPEAQQFRINGELPRLAGDVQVELTLCQELSRLAGSYPRNSTPNFVRTVDARVVGGQWPIQLLEAWDNYAAKKTTENDRPDPAHVDLLHHLLIVQSNGGADLDHFRVETEAYYASILFQVCLSLVAAEKQLRFEHRDLHIGNVLVQETTNVRMDYRLDGADVALNNHGIRVTIIDYTNARLERDGNTIYFDLEQDPDIFTGKGLYQFDVYRLMRKANGRDWARFEPKSNLLWVHYLSKEMLKGKKKGISKSRKQALQKVFDKALKYDSITAFLEEPALQQLKAQYIVNT
ncbi:unnamed protein product, partial [Mesorhabditis spiculigera]